MKKHILVISQCFYPEQFRINDICTEWVNRGYQVTVITGIPNYPQGRFHNGYGYCKKRKEFYNGIEIIRLPLIPRGHNPVMLVLNYFSFVLSGFFWKLFTRIKADKVFIFETSPMTQALLGVWYARRRRVPCYLYVQDLWPENVEIITGIKNRFIIGSIGRMVDYIYKRCTRIFTTSMSFVTSIHKRNVPLEKIECWPQYAEDFYRPLNALSIPEIPQDDAFNIIYAGNIGAAQGLDILPLAAEIIKTRATNKIRFNIVGDGRYMKTFISRIEALGVQDLFHFVPIQPATRIPEFLAVCDAAFLSLTDSPLFAMTIPAKLQTYLACGIPVIASSSGETERIISESGSGVCSQPGKAADLAEHIIAFTEKPHEELRRLGQKARIYYMENFDKQKLLDRMDEHLAAEQ